MPGNSFGQIFRITTFGESHGPAIGVVIDGCPPGLQLGPADIEPELARRRPGQSHITSARQEPDQVRILSGVFEGHTSGSPITIVIENKDARPEDYEQLKHVFRPSHADYTYQAKYGRRDYRGSGRASARETVARVAAGAVAKKYLAEKLNIEVLSYVHSVGEIEAHLEPELVDIASIESSGVRCPDRDASAKMLALIEEVQSAGDSVGGVICGLIKNVPVGLGEPVFDKLHADLGKAMLSINAVRAFELGLGFEVSKLRGSENNDEYYSDNRGSVRTSSNRHAGILGGISSGETIMFRVGFKPPSTIQHMQNSIDDSGQAVKFSGTGRHDPCVLPRAVPIVDAMARLVIIDHYLRHKAQNR